MNLNSHCVLYLSVDETFPPSFIYLLCGALAFTTSVVVCLTVSVFKMSKRHSQQTGTVLPAFETDIKYSYFCSFEFKININFFTDSSDVFCATHRQNTQVRVISGVIYLFFLFMMTSTYNFK